MKEYLMKDGQTAMHLEMILGTMSMIVADAEVINASLLPPGLRLPIQAGLVKNPAEAVCHWLRCRHLPDYREGLDDMMIKAYALKAYQMGRMYKTQHTAAVLSYFVSGFDHYYLTPEKMETICYALEDFHFSSLYLLQTCSRETADAIRQGCTPSGPGIFAASPDYTIPSGCVSWWECTGESRCLAQKPGAKAMQIYHEVIQPRFRSDECDGIVRIHSPQPHGDVMWLSELTPYLQWGQGDPWKQLEVMLQDSPGCNQALSILQECETAARQDNRFIAWNEMGIDCTEQTADPIIIL